MGEDFRLMRIREYDLPKNVFSLFTLYSFLNRIGTIQEHHARILLKLNVSAFLGSMCQHF